MPRLLILCEFPSLLGGEHSMFSTLARVAAAGYEPIVAAPPTGDLAAELARRNVAHVPWLVRSTAEPRATREQQRAALSRLMDTVQPDVIHANSLSMGRLSGPVVAAKNLPSVAHLRDILRLTAQARRDLHGHGRLLAVSQATRAFHVEAGLSSEKTRVVYNGVDLELFRPRRATGYLNRELALPPSAPLVGGLGQISLRKGIDVLVAAASQVAAVNRDVHFVWAGSRLSEKQESRRLEQDLRSLTARPPLRGRFHMLSTRSDIATMLAEFTIMVHPARQEPLGRTLLEAGATGRPIVATAVGGTAEIFPPQYQAAILVAADDSAAMAAAILSLLGDASLRRHLGSAARRRIESAFGVDRAAEALLEQYEAVRSGSWYS